VRSAPSGHTAVRHYFHSTREFIAGSGNGKAVPLLN
jgi:hypothetical protein